MARFVLVHGASHGAWCWAKMIPRLRALGHEVTAIDLPGNGVNSPTTRDVTLADYREAVLAALTPDTILVGHSFGGVSITLAAAASDQVRALVYVASVLPENGKRFADFRRECIAPIVNEVTEPKDGFSVPRTDLCGPVFYSDCTPEDQAFALHNMTPQPVSVMLEPMTFSTSDVPRHYVRCTRDQVVLPDYQRRITESWPKESVHELATGHSPFFSDVDGFVAVLDVIQARTT